MLLARVAGVAWLAGFSLSVAFAAQFAMRDIGAIALIAISFLIYGLWALLLGVSLVRKPSRRVVIFSSLFGALQLLWLFSYQGTKDPAEWLLSAPDVTAAIASFAALIAWRHTSAPSGLLTLIATVTLAPLMVGCTWAKPTPSPSPMPFAPDELGATLPADVRGKPLTRIDLDVLFARMANEPTMVAFLNDRELELDDVLVAQATWERETATGHEVVSIGALRVPGVPAEETDSALPTPSATELGGRPGRAAIQDGKAVFFYTWADGTLTFKYPKGEVLYVVVATDPIDARAGLAALP
ncbi:MAG TPA: hypothetical protein VM305_09125 [Candidatus Limnocylindrales bacterium]|nr:hypothetical protein [Candidatus Limnocylindrales bacterium]